VAHGVVSYFNLQRRDCAVTLSRTQIPKFVYIGQGGPLSIIPLKSLCDKGIRPDAVIVSDTSQQPLRLNLLPVRPPRLKDSLAGLADEIGLPVIYWQRGCEADIAANLADISPELVIMSCFPWRIPESLLKIPALGWWNLHPSLLPAYRGPTPIFWQARAGETETGISLHQVIADLDSGAILGQHAMAWGDRVGRELEIGLAQQGAKLIEQALHALAQNELQSWTQSKGDASYQGFPKDLDTCIETAGRASAAYRYIRVVGSAYRLWFEINSQRYDVTAALEFDDQAVLGYPYQYHNGQLQVQFEQGVLTVACQIMV